MSNKKKQTPPILASFGSVAKSVHPNRVIEEASKDPIDIDSKDDIKNNIDIEKDSNKDIDSDINNDINIKNNIKETDFAERAPRIKGTKSILSEVSKAQKARQKRQQLVYLDSDVADALDAFAEGHGKGAKSELMNRLLRDTFDLD